MYVNMGKQLCVARVWARAVQRNGECGAAETVKGIVNRVVNGNASFEYQQQSR